MTRSTAIRGGVDNLSQTRALKGRTPAGKLTGLKRDISKLNVCSCIEYVFVPKEVWKNILPVNAEPALFLGFSWTGHGYRLLNRRSGKMVQLRDAKFPEDLTVECTYINPPLKSREGYYPQHSLPVETVAEQESREKAGDIVLDVLNDAASGRTTRDRHDTAGQQVQSTETVSSVEEATRNGSCADLMRVASNESEEDQDVNCRRVSAVE